VPDRLLRLDYAVAQARETVTIRLPRGDSVGPGSASAALPAAPAVPTMPPPPPQPLAQPASPQPVASLPQAQSADDTDTAEADEDEGSRPAPEFVAQSATTDSASATAFVASAPAAASAEPGSGRILLRAREENWVQVRDGSNAPVMTRVLKPGDVLKVPDRNGLTLMTGNAGGLDILVDGEAVPSLGAPGQVRRNVALDADKLKAGTAIGRP
jgi:cytoskeleton protein RodZ